VARAVIAASLWTAVPNCNARREGRDGASRIGHTAMMAIVEKEPERRTSTDRRAVRRGQVAADLLAALEGDGIEVLFQPQFAADGALTGAEALACWHHPTRGRLGGAELFALAQHAHRVEPLSRHIGRTALAAAASWPHSLRLSLNVTASDLAAEDFAELIARKLTAAGFPPERLTLEITEQSLVAELGRSAERLRQLTRLGIRIALDDFGAGFCNFSYLKQLPLHYLKLDRAMVEGIDESPRDLAVLRGIVAMAHALGLEVIAEGIERESQREAAVREGCAGWQGFLGAEPMSATDFAELTMARAAQVTMKSV
jgi:EAL domain-containing protein (putative c-di-GMP-specific phosphodiesterase class I)